MGMTMTAPKPRLGGSYTYCPMVDVPAIEAGRKPDKEGLPGLMCDWRRRGRSARILRSYQRHWQHKHWGPFTAEYRQLSGREL